MSEINLAKVWNARTWAEQAHGTQCYGPFLPYVYHLDQVASLLVPYGEQAVIVGYLHDVLEDTKVEYDSLALAFGGPVAMLVAIVTDEVGRNRRERKSATNAKLVKIQATWATSLALVVKAADRLANLRQCVLELKNPQPGQSPDNSKLQMYCREATEFRYAVWRPNLCDHLWAEIDRIIDGGVYAPSQT